MKVLRLEINYSSMRHGVPQTSRAKVWLNPVIGGSNAPPSWNGLFFHAFSAEIFLSGGEFNETDGGGLVKQPSAAAALQATDDSSIIGKAPEGVYEL